MYKKEPEIRTILEKFTVPQEETIDKLKEGNNMVFFSKGICFSVSRR